MDGAQPISLVLSGGVALGSYQGGAYQALLDHSLSVRWIAGSSVGALNGALIAGSSPERRLDTLRNYWLERTLSDVAPFVPAGGMRHAVNWLSVLQARLFGSPGHVQTVGPRLSFSSFYDLAPTVAYLKRTIDFGRLNCGDIRFTVATTDIETGDVAIFDTGKGDRIGIEHLTLRGMVRSENRRRRAPLHLMAAPHRWWFCIRRPTAPSASHCGRHPRPGMRRLSGAIALLRFQRLAAYARIKIRGL